MRKRVQIAVSVLVAVALIAMSATAYHDFMSAKIYDESSENLVSTYEQIDKTFELFAQRNWNVLADWDNTLQSATAADDVSAVWNQAKSRKDSWNYDEVYLFNKSNAFITDSDRMGNADSIDGVFQEMYAAGKPWISSYIASDGNRKIVFAVPLSQPFTHDGVTYDGLAVSYDNDVVMDMVAGKVFRGQSDCYVVHSSGDVVFSLQPKSEIEQFVSNIFEYLGKHATFSRGSLAEAEDRVGHKKAGSAFCSFNGRDYYLVYQPAGIGDWSVVGLVRADAVDSGMNEVQFITMGAIGIVGVTVAAAAIAAVIRMEHKRLQRKEEERLAAEHQRLAINQLLGGLRRIIDRFAVIDLVDGTYEYQENVHGDRLYPQKGRYADLVDAVTQRYVTFSDTEDAKLSHLLSPERLREMVGEREDVIRIEYCGRNEDVYKVLNIIPLDWDSDGTVTRLMFVSQDIGQRVELQTMANTDGLTGLFNERYFSSTLRAREATREPFTLFYLDLDRFKPVNDTYGHDTGDKLLKAVAARLVDCVRSTDFAFRIGGDEFALVLDSELADDMCQMMFERITTAVSRPYDIDGAKIDIGTSCGWARYPGEGNAEEIRILADRRMYDCKERNHAER